MSLTDAFSAPFQLMRGTEAVPVPLLTMDQLAAQVAVLEARRAARLRKNIVEQKLTPADAAKFLEIAERDELTIYDLSRHAESIRGANEILKVVLAPDVLAALSPEERITAAQGALGWKPKPKAAEGEQGANPPVSSNGN